MSNTPPDGQGSTRTDHTQVIPAIVKCACGRDITLAELQHIYRARSPGIVAKFHPYLVKTMNEYGILTCLERSHFLAQVGVESEQLGLTAEKLARGKTEQGSYGGYKGRGLLQLTLIGNYTAYGNYKHLNLLGPNRLKLEKPDLATDSAGWFWLHGKPVNLNTSAQNNDLIQISVTINGGFNGYDDRLALLIPAGKALNISSCQNFCSNGYTMPDSLAHYTLDKSAEYNSASSCFSWGYWNDPQAPTTGIANKNHDDMVMGYSRFVELANQNPPKHRRFGRTPEQLVEYAKKRINS